MQFDTVLNNARQCIHETNNKISFIKKLIEEIRNNRSVQKKIETTDLMEYHSTGIYQVQMDDKTYFVEVNSRCKDLKLKRKTIEVWLNSTGAPDTSLQVLLRVFEEHNSTEMVHKGDIKINDYVHDFCDLPYAFRNRAKEYIDGSIDNIPHPVSINTAITVKMRPEEYCSELIIPVLLEYKPFIVQKYMNSDGLEYTPRIQGIHELIYGKNFTALTEDHKHLIDDASPESWLFEMQLQGYTLEMINSLIGTYGVSCSRISSEFVSTEIIDTIFSTRRRV